MPQERLTALPNSYGEQSNLGQGIVSYQVVQEFFDVALRRFAEPMSSADAEQYRGFFGAQARSEVLRDLPFEMELDFIVQSLRALVTPEESLQLESR